MLNEELALLSSLEWIPSRVPPRKALVTFLPEGPECPPAVRIAMQERSGSRWIPEEGGHRVLFLYEGGPYDEAVFRLEAEGWDHEDCNACASPVPAMALCYVTDADRYIVLCPACYDKHVTSARAGCRISAG
jgi:hypothetical protein